MLVDEVVEAGDAGKSRGEAERAAGAGHERADTDLQKNNKIIKNLMDEDIL